jgi:hypothetical protein
MPVSKDFKRLVRGRMQKTGESYTAARANLLKKPRGVSAPPASAPPDYARMAGMADDKLVAKTGRTWAEWVQVLDRVEAHRWPHREIARHVYEQYTIDGWWAQTVTVGYERIRGLRERGQRRSGTYEVNKSRTIPVPVTRLFRAFTQASLRSQWLPGVALTVRGSTPNKYIRITWEDGTSVLGGFSSKGRSKAQVALAHVKLPSNEVAARMKRYWTERLDALAAMLARGEYGKA